MARIEWGRPSEDPIELHPSLQRISALSKITALLKHNEEINPEDSTAVIEGIMGRIPNQKNTLRQNISDIKKVFELIGTGLAPHEAMDHIRVARQEQSQISTLIFWWDEKAHTTTLGGQRAYRAKGVALGVNKAAVEGVDVYRTGAETEWMGLDYLARNTDYATGYFDWTWEQRLLFAYANSGRGGRSHLPAFEGFSVPYVELDSQKVPGCSDRPKVYGRILDWPFRRDWN